MNAGVCGVLSMQRRNVEVGEEEEMRRAKNQRRRERRKKGRELARAHQGGSQDGAGGDGPEECEVGRPLP
jgi:hypothetical protein